MCRLRVVMVQPQLLQHHAHILVAQVQPQRHFQPLVQVHAVLAHREVFAVHRDAAHSLLANGRALLRFRSGFGVGTTGRGERERVNLHLDPGYGRQQEQNVPLRTARNPPLDIGRFAVRVFFVLFMFGAAVVGLVVAVLVVFVGDGRFHLDNQLDHASISMVVWLGALQNIHSIHNPWTSTYTNSSIENMSDCVLNDAAIIAVRFL